MKRKNCWSSPATSWPPRRHLDDVTHTHTHTHTCTHTHTRTWLFALILMCPVTGVPSAEPGSLSMLRFARASSPNIERAYKLAARNPHSPVRAWRTGRLACLLAVLKLWVWCEWACRVIVLVLHEYVGTYVRTYFVQVSECASMQTHRGEGGRTLCLSEQQTTHLLWSEALHVGALH